MRKLPVIAWQWFSTGPPVSFTTYNWLVSDKSLYGKNVTKFEIEIHNMAKMLQKREFEIQIFLCILLLHRLDWYGENVAKNEIWNRNSLSVLLLQSMRYLCYVLSFRFLHGMAPTSSHCWSTCLYLWCRHGDEKYTSVSTPFSIPLHILDKSKKWPKNIWNVCNDF